MTKTATAPRRVPEGACAYEEYDPATLVPVNAGTYTRLLELGWNEQTFADRSVLDIGCNSGILSLHAHRLGAAHVRSVDVQPPLVEFFADVVERHELPIEVARMSLDDLDAEAHAADVVLFMEVLHWIVDQGGTVAEAIAKLATLTRETLFLETPWDVLEPSIASRGKLTADDYGIERILKELHHHFASVEVVRFMTYFGEMPGSKRVLLKASGRRLDSDILARLDEVSPLDVSLSRGSNPVSLLSSPRGAKVLKTLPAESILSRLDHGTLNAFVEHLESAEERSIVLPERIGESYVAVGGNGRRCMLFPFVGDLGDYFPELRTPAPVDSPLAIAVETCKSLSGMPREVIEGFRRHSARIPVCGLEQLSATMLDALRRERLLEPLGRSLERMSGYDAEREDAIVHHDLQLGNMIRDASGHDRVIDLDLVRTGTAYSDLLCAAIYCGASVAELDEALDELERYGLRPLSRFDIDFSVTTVLNWAREISRQNITLPAEQLQSVVTGLKSVSGCLGARRCEVADPALSGDALVAFARAELVRMPTDDESREHVRRLCLLAIGASPRDAALREAMCERLETSGMTELADRVRTARPMLSDLSGLAGRSADPSRLARLFEPSEGYAREQLSTGGDDTVLTADNERLGGDTVTPSAWVRKHHGIRSRPLVWESAVVEDAAVFFHRGTFAVLDADGRPLEAMSHPDYRLLYLNREFLTFAASCGDAPRLERALYAQDTIGGPNYCHWLLDATPRTRLLEEADHLLISESESSFVQETLARVGVSPERVIELRRCPALRIGRLKVESSVARDFFHPAQNGCPALVEYVRKLFDAPSDIETHERIYLSRNRSWRRRIANEDELLPVLRELGFRTVHAEEHSLLEQARLFREARVVVAPHGAGLSNLIFSRSGCKVLELFDPNYGTASFYSLAKRTGLIYVSMECEGERLSEEQQLRCMGELQRGDITVDASRFEMALRALLALRPDAVADIRYDRVAGL